MNSSNNYPVLPQKIKFPIYKSMFWKLLDLSSIIRAFFIRFTKCEKLIKQYFFGKEIVLTSSGSAALTIAIKSLNLAIGDTILCSSFNCPSVINAIYTAGSKPQFIDLNDNFQMDDKIFEQTINKRTRAVILTHTYGVHESQKIIDVARKHSLAIINDVSQYIFFSEEKIGHALQGDFCIYSFGPTKPIGLYGGGILARISSKYKISDEFKKMNYVCNTNEILYIMKVNLFNMLFSNKKTRDLGIKLGIIPELKESIIENLPQSIESIKPKRISIIQARVILLSLLKKDEILMKSIENYKQMYESIEPYNCFVRMLPPDKGYFNYATLIFKNERIRWNMSSYLAEEGVQTSWNYYPLHKIPVYKSKDDGLINTNRLWKCVLSIPFKYPYSQQNIEQLCNIIKLKLERVQNENTKM